MRTVWCSNRSSTTIPWSDLARRHLRTPLNVEFLNPAYDEVPGRASNPSLADLAEAPEVVDIFRREEIIPPWGPPVWRSLETSWRRYVTGSDR